MILKQTVDLEPGESKPVIFLFAPTEARPHSVAIEGLSGGFNVLPVTPPILSHSYEVVGNGSITIPEHLHHHLVWEIFEPQASVVVDMINDWWDEGVGLWKELKAYNQGYLDVPVGAYEDIFILPLQANVPNNVVFRTRFWVTTQNGQQCLAQGEFRYSYNPFTIIQPFIILAASCGL